MYAREKIRPKLYELDQDKLAKLFADLRRESLATGSFPITVRHLESMIRMSEASAKMALREYVRGDDIDLAIQVTVGSFVSAQKMSIKKTLERVSLPTSGPSHLMGSDTYAVSNRGSGSISFRLAITRSCWRICSAKWSRKRQGCTSTRGTRNPTSLQ